MSENIHLHDADDNHIGDICVPGALEYRTFVHEFGAHKFIFDQGPFDSIAEAFAALGKTLEKNRHKAFRYNRAVITSVEKGETYYEPEWAYEVIVR